MHALVTGATGFIGRHLVRALIDEGFSVRALVRNTRRARMLPSETQLYFGDLTNSESLSGIADGVDVVFHLGAAMAGDWEVHRRATLEGTRELLLQASEASVSRFIHVSSIIGYESSGLRDGDVINETSPIASPETAHGPYARGKVAAELVVAEFSANHSLSTTIVRPGLVYGPGHIIFEHLGKRIGNFFVAYGSRKQLLPLVSVQSVVDALIRIAQSPETVGKTYLIVDENNSSRVDYLLLLGELTGKRYRLINLPLRLSAIVFDMLGWIRKLPGLKKLPATSAAKIRSRALSLRYDSSALKEATGWKPPLTLRKGLSRALETTADSGSAIKAIRVGIIGAGVICDYHLSALAKVPQVQIVGILDIKPSQAKVVAARHGLSCFYEDPERFYEHAKPDVVHVLTPPPTHHSVALTALNRGIHVLCEKPMAMIVDECQEMMQAAQTNRVSLAVNHNFLYDPRVQLARSAVEKGRIGDVIHIEILLSFDVRRLKHFSADSSETRHWAFSLPGGLLEDLAPHALSFLAAFLGRDVMMTHLSLQRHNRISADLDDELRASFAANGVTANLIMSLSIRPDDFTVNIYGTTGTIKIDIQNMLLQKFHFGRGLKSLARALMVTGASLKALYQIGSNALMLAAGRIKPPGDMIPLFQAYYASYAIDQDGPVGPEEGMLVVKLLREIWPQAKLVDQTRV